MKNTILLYGSTTGNTETLAGYVEEGLQKGELEVTKKDVTEASIEDIVNSDLIVLGCSTWGEGELQDDFIDFYDEIERKKVDLSGKKVAVFGPGDSDMYPDTFCEAVNILTKRLKECGAELVTESYKVDGDVEDVKEEAEAWGLKVSKLLG